MAAPNTAPIYSKVGDIQFGKVTGVDGGTDGTDADVVVIFTADATNGGLVTDIRFQPRSTSGSTSTSVAKANIYINNGSSIGTGTNNVLIDTINLPVIPVNVAGTAMEQGYWYAFNRMLPPGYKIAIGITAIAANTSWDCTAFGGKY